MAKISAITMRLFQQAAVFYEETGNMEGFLKMMKVAFYNEMALQSEQPYQPHVTRYSRKESPFKILFKQHQEKIREVFRNKEEKLNRPDVIAKICELYDVGKNKVEERDGYLNHLFRLNLIQKTKARGVYQAGSELFIEYPDEVAPILEEMDAKLAQLRASFAGNDGNISLKGNEKL